MLLEGTAGAGGQLGTSPAELRALAPEGAADRIGLCLDTAHLWGTGYDLRGDGWERVLGEVGEAWLRSAPDLLGNDTRPVKLGSRRDRHAPPGEEPGEVFFRHLLTDERCARVPLIVEIPPGEGNREVARVLTRLRAWSGGQAADPASSWAARQARSWTSARPVRLLKSTSMSHSFSRVTLDRVPPFLVATDRQPGPILRVQLRKRFSADDGLRLAIQLCRRRDTFVDLGANLGYYTLPMAARGVRTLAVEALPQLRDARRLPGEEQLHQCHGGPCCGMGDDGCAQHGGTQRLGLCCPERRGDAGAEHLPGRPLPDLWVCQTDPAEDGR